MESEVNQVVRKRIWFWLRLAMSLALLIWLLWKFNLQSVTDALSMVSVKGSLGLLFGLLLARLLVFFRFWFLLHTEGADFSLGTIIRLSFFSVFLGNFLPSTVGGDVPKVGWLASKGYPLWRGALWALFDRLSNVVAISLLLPFCLLLPSFQAKQWQFLLSEKAGLNFAGTYPAVYGLVLLLVFIFLGFSLLLVRLHSDKSFDLDHTASRGKLQLLWRALLARSGKFAILVLISIVSILPVLFGIWLAAQDLAIYVNFAQVTAVYVVLYLVTLVPISINGLGIQEVSMVYLYQGLGATFTQAGALAILFRAAILLTTLAGAFWLGGGIGSENVPGLPDTEVSLVKGKGWRGFLR